MSFINIFGGSTVQAAQVAYRAVALSANVALAWPWDSRTATDVAARTMDVTASAPSLAITMPDATEVSVGYDFLITNQGSNTFSVKDAAGGVITTLSAGQVRYLQIIGVATAAGSWRVILFGASATAIDAASLVGPGIGAESTYLVRSEPVVEFSLSNAVGLADRAKVFVWTGGTGVQNLPVAAVVGSEFSYEVRNQGTGILTITPNGVETIDDSPSIGLQPTESVRVHSSGAGTWFTVGRGRSTQFNYSLLVKGVTGGSDVLTSTEASNTVQRYTGVLTSAETITVPPVVQVYFVSNQTTGPYTLTLTTGLGGTTLAVPSGQNAVMFCDGVNVINASTTVAAVLSLLLDQGSLSAPSLAFSGDATTGIFQPSIGNMAIAVALTNILNASASGVSITGALGVSGAATANGGVELGNRKLVPASVTTGAFVAADSGKCVYATGGVTVPNSTMAQGDCVTIHNTTSGNITITATVATLEQAGTANTGNRTLAQKGVATVLFKSATSAVISGAGLS